MSVLSPTSTKTVANAPNAKPSAGRLVIWMVTLGLRHPWRCLWVFLLNLLVMALSLIVLTATGLNFDLLRHATDPTAPPPVYRLGFHPPAGFSPLQTILLLNGAIVVLAMLRAGLRFVTALAQAQLVQVMLTRLRTEVYDKLQRLSFRFFDANETGTLINRATSDVSSIPVFMDQAVIQIVMLVVSLAVSVVYMYRINGMLTAVCLVSVPLLSYASVVYSRVVRPAYDETRKLYDRVVLRLSENTQGKHAVKGFALEPHEIARFREANDKLREHQRWLFKRTSLYSATVVLLTQLNLMLVLLAGGWLVIRSQGMPKPLLTLGDLIIFAALLQQLAAQVTTIANVTNTLQTSLTAAQRVWEVLQTPLEIRSPANALPLRAARGHVIFDHVSFEYLTGEPALRDVSFEVKPGQCVAIVGATGAGKSSLLSLIPRFYDPTSGRVLLDGHDLSELNLDDLRRNIGLVFQESFLFSNSIAFNIAFGMPGASREQIEHAAHVAAAHGFIQEMPQGYETIVGEHGAGLSGGQRQRLAIARAILPEPSILILDDATAAIDPETEHEILSAMERAMEGRTTFVVAHRLSTLRRADFIVVLEKGRVVQTGTHEQLMSQPGYYREVAVLQLADQESKFIIHARRWEAGEVNSPFPESSSSAYLPGSN